jgi:hypothetical protein
LITVFSSSSTALANRCLSLFYVVLLDPKV